MDSANDGTFWTVCFGSSPRERRAGGWFSVAAFIWAVAWVAAVYTLGHQLVAAPMSWVIAAVPAVFGVTMLLLFARYLRELDELQRRIQLGALAFGLGVTWIAITAYPVFELAGAPKAGSASYILVMVLSYMAGNVVAWVRYR